jgi:hypothetical protein
MKDLFLWFWTVMIFVSIGWYFFLIFYVGAKGGTEIHRLIQSREQRQPEDEKDK